MKVDDSIRKLMVESGQDPDKLRAKRSGPNKYGAKPTVYAGVRYASMAEADRAARLDAAAPMGVWWIGQPRFRLGCPENVYVADFLVVGMCKVGVHVEDVKGMQTAKFKKDVRLWRAYGPCELWIIKGKKIEIIPGKEA